MPSQHPDRPLEAHEIRRNSEVLQGRIAVAKRQGSRTVSLNVRYAEYLLQEHEAHRKHVASLGDRLGGGGSTPSGWDHYG